MFPWPGVMVYSQLAWWRVRGKVFRLWMVTISRKQEVLLSHHLIKTCRRTLTNLLQICGEISKHRRGWGATVQRRLFWLEQRQGNHTTLRCPVQMTTTRSSSATSYCADRRRESPSTHLIERRIELKVRIVIVIITTQISHYSHRSDRLHSFYYYLSFQTPVAFCDSGWGAWTGHNLQQPTGDWHENGTVHPSRRSPCKNAVVRTTDTYIFVILLCHAHATKQADCIPWYRVRETSTTNQPLWSRSIPRRRLLCDSSWDVFSGVFRLHQCLQREGGKWGPWKRWRRTPGFIKCFCNLVRNGFSSLTC